MKDLVVYAHTIEQEAEDQINELLNQPAFADSKVRIMPDVHAGKGCVIGFTSTYSGKIIPNIVGVDIGCGVSVLEFTCKSLDLEKIDNIIRSHVPSGSNVFENVDSVKFRIAVNHIERLYCFSRLRDLKRLESSIGTLGGGNHFIEIAKSKDKYYLLVHSGSRNLGTQVARLYQEDAEEHCSYKYICDEYKKQTIEFYKAIGHQEEIQEQINRVSKYCEELSVAKDLCYIEGYSAKKYLHDMKCCQNFAYDNRLNISSTILTEYNSSVDEDDEIKFIDYWESVHNYIDVDAGIIRKGAVAANVGQKVIIPMNMRDGSLICIGKGNKDWNCSAPHGAGRIMSRIKAKETLSLDDFKKSMDGIYTTSVDASTIDEAPMVYKPVEEIKALIEPTVEIVEQIKPIYNFKASDLR